MEGRLDVYYYKPYFIKSFNDLKKSKYDIVKLDEVCLKITDGTHFTPSYKEKGIHFLSVKDVRENNISFGNTRFISEEEHNKLIKRCRPESSDILLTKIGTIGLVAVIPENVPEFSIFVSVALLKADKGKVNPYYISTYLNSKYTKFQTKRAVKGIGVPDLHLENIKNIQIPLPPLETQNKIVSLMDSAYERKKKMEKEAEELMKGIDEYVMSELGIDNFETTMDLSSTGGIYTGKQKFNVYTVSSERLKHNWDVRHFLPKYDENFKHLNESKYELSNISSITSKINRGKTPKYTDEGIPVLKIASLKNGRIILTGEYISVEFFESSPSAQVFKDNILVSSTGEGSIGKVAKYNMDSPAMADNHTNIIRVNMKQANPDYVTYFLRLKCGILQIEQAITGSTGQTELYSKNLENIRIPLPPLKIQQKIAKEVKRRINKADQLKKEGQKILAEAKDRVEGMILG